MSISERLESQETECDITDETQITETSPLSLKTPPKYSLLRIHSKYIIFEFMAYADYSSKSA